MIEAAAGLLDGKSPESRIRMEVEEELGLRLREVRRVFACFMSPGSVTERLYFFVGQYDSSMRVAGGGGSRDEGEDIEVIEPTIDEALRMIEAGDICDGKTVILLQYAALNLFSPSRDKAQPHGV